MAGFKDLGASGPLFTSDELRVWCKVDPTGDGPTDTDVSAELLRLAAAFTALAETEMNRAILRRAFQMSAPRFPCGRAPLSLQLGGVHQVTTITYLPPDGGAAVTLAQAGTWELDDFEQPASVVMLPGLSWPSVALRPNAVKVDFTAGWENAAAVPEAVKHWVLAHVADMNRNREASGDKQPHALPYLSNLLDPFRVFLFA